jgi:hypothetical protein
MLSHVPKSLKVFFKLENKSLNPTSPANGAGKTSYLPAED